MAEKAYCSGCDRECDILTECHSLHYSEYSVQSYDDDDGVFWRVVHKSGDVKADGFDSSADAEMYIHDNLNNLHDYEKAN